MNSTSLHALIVDQHFGEISPEVADLLESHLALNADARAEAERIRKALAVTEQTILQHPELGRGDAAESRLTPAPPRRRSAPMVFLAKAAAIALLAALIGAGGFFAGQRRETTPHSGAVAADAGMQPASPAARPWARYRFAPGASGSLQVVRVETKDLENRTIR